MKRPAKRAREFWYNAPKRTRMNTQRAVTLVILLILVVVVLAAIVLVSGGAPAPAARFATPTSPFILDRPEALSRPAN